MDADILKSNQKETKAEIRLQKFVTWADCFLLALFCSVMFGAVLSIATQEKFVLQKSWVSISLLTVGMTGSIYRLQQSKKD
jgi:hypothetical protein